MSIYLSDPWWDNWSLTDEIKLLHNKYLVANEGRVELKEVMIYKRL